jgi:hypothetical protein
MVSIDLLAAVFLFSFLICVGCSDRWWGSKKWVNTRWWILHVFNTIGSIAFVWCFFLMFKLNSPR